MDVPVTKINIYSDDRYIYGIKLHWDSISKVVLYGDSTKGTKSSLTGTFTKSQVYKDTSGYLRAIIFYNQFGLPVAGGLDPPVWTTAFDNDDDVFTDLITHIGEVESGVFAIWGVKLYYTGPAVIVPAPAPPCCKCTIL